MAKRPPAEESELPGLRQALNGRAAVVIGQAIAQVITQAITLSIKPCSLPAAALLARYVGDRAYTDCYRVEIPGTVTQVEFVVAFYTTWVFKLERAILQWAVSRASTDLDARQLAEGEIDRFSAWSVEDRNQNQLLMCDFQGRTRSWLMTLPAGDQDTAATGLYFGSAVVAQRDPNGVAKTGLLFRALLGFHKVYSKILLHAAKTRLLRQPGTVS